jgi:excisionase family DNA binding protein
MRSPRAVVTTAEVEATLTVAQVASALQLAPKTVRAMCVRREIGHHRVGAEYRFRLADLHALLDRTRIEPVKRR